MRIIETQPNIQDAVDLMEELSKSLEIITGDSGKSSFNDHDQKPYSICRYIDYNVTISSKTLAPFIMVPEEGAIHVAAGNPCECEYARYEF